jgi:Beta-lactamase enzyme family
MKRILRLLSCLLLLSSCQKELKEDENLLLNLMMSQADQFKPYLDSADQFEIQIIYTQINRDSNNRPAFRSFSFRTDSTNYFYPASTVKLPLVLLAFEKLNNLKIAGLDKFTPLFHDSVYTGQVAVSRDSTSENGLPSIAHYAKKILVVSDNDAYNRLYEFMGQKATNELLKGKGYNMRILHRLERPLTPDQNRHTEAVRFVQNDSVIFSQPMLVNPDSIRPMRMAKKGTGFMKGEAIVSGPFDFTYKNFYPLEEQQEILKTILFPDVADPKRKFNLTEDDRQFVLQYMSQLPGETLYPPYHADTSLHDAYCKFLMFGESKQSIPSNIRIFNKVGDAYGFLIDNAYVVDFDNNVEFMLSAVINTNTDGVYNDGIYDYARLGFPFMKKLGQLIYNYELKRKRPHSPDLTGFRLTYDR